MYNHPYPVSHLNKGNTELNRPTSNFRRYKQDANFLSFSAYMSLVSFPISCVNLGRSAFKSLTLWTVAHF